MIFYEVQSQGDSPTASMLSVLLQGDGNYLSLSLGSSGQVVARLSDEFSNLALRFRDVMINNHHLFLGVDLV